MKKTIKPVLCALLVVALIIGANLIMPASGTERIPIFADKDLPTITETSGFVDVPPDAWQLCLATCNDSGGVNVTITFWKLESVTVNEAA